MRALFINNEWWRFVILGLVSGAATGVMYGTDFLGINQGILLLLMSIWFGVPFGLIAYRVSIIIKPIKRSDDSTNRCSDSSR